MYVVDVERAFTHAVTGQEDVLPAWVVNSESEIAALLEHVVLNHHNQRSLAWVAQTLNGRLHRLHQREAPGAPDLSQRLQPPDIASLGQLCQADAIGDFIHLQALLRTLGDGAKQLSDAIALRYFSQADDARRSLGA